MYPEPGQRKAKDLLYLAHSLDGSMASIALDDDSQNSTDSSNLNVDEIWKSIDSDLPKTSIAMGVAGGQQSASVQAMLNKISATAKKKKRKRRKKKIRSRKPATPVVIINVKAIKRKLKKQIKHTVDSILSRKSFVPSGEEPNGDENTSDKPSSELVLAGEAAEPKFSDVTAEEFLRRHKRDINCLSSDVMVTRKDAILKFLNIFVHRVGEEVRPTDDICIEVYEELMKPLLKRFADKSEYCRLGSIKLVNFFYL